MSLAVHFCGTTHEAGKPCPRCEGSNVATGSALPDTVDARPGEKFSRLAFGAQRCTQCGRRSLPRTCFMCASVGIPADPANSWKGPSPTGYPFPPMPVLDAGLSLDRTVTVTAADLNDAARLRTENDTLRLQNEQLTKDCESIAQTAKEVGALSFGDKLREVELTRLRDHERTLQSRLANLERRFYGERADLMSRNVDLLNERQAAETDRDWYRNELRHVKPKLVEAHDRNGKAGK